MISTWYLVNSIEELHSHILTINNTTPTPSNWRALLECRSCKHHLLKYLADSMLEFASNYMNNHTQKFITAGPREPRSCNTTGHIKEEHQYKCEAVEADSRLWRHSTKCGYSRQLIYCPDTDGYIVGLTNHNSSADIVMELTKVGSKDRKLLFMRNLTDSLERDPDISLVPTQDLPGIIQALCACTGCNYTSFFSGVGKCSFFKAFCRYSDFICGPRAKGSLSHWKSKFLFSFS